MFVEDLYYEENRRKSKREKKNKVRKIKNGGRKTTKINEKIEENGNTSKKKSRSK